MSQGNRPGGLTALAIINFVLAGLGCIAGLSLLMQLAFLGSVSESSDSVVITEVISSSEIIVSLVLGTLVVALLVVSAIGYLGLKKTLGFKLGVLYAIVSILDSVTGVMMSQYGFGIMNVIGFIYPVMTLFLLTTVFKDDFVN